MSFPTEHNITARGIRHGDVFVLHGHVRTADGGAWPAHPGHVHIAFADGGDAILPADRPVTVTRMVEDAPCSV